MKIVIIPVIVLLSMASCRKSRTCECVTKENGVVVSSSSFTIKTRKSVAETACSGESTYSGYGGTTTSECSLK